MPKWKSLALTKSTNRLYYSTSLNTECKFSNCQLKRCDFQPVIHWQGICSLKSWNGIGRGSINHPLTDINLDKCMHSFSILPSLLHSFQQCFWESTVCQTLWRFLQRRHHPLPVDLTIHWCIKTQKQLWQVINTTWEILTMGLGKFRKEKFNCLVTSELGIPGWGGVCWAEKREWGMVQGALGGVVGDGES